MLSRILRIDKVEGLDEFEISLEPTYDKVEPYVTLSYCWGGDQACKTTKSRMRSGNLSIPYGKLAQSIQDAIKVTSRLGLQYLWVDALCIIQDDEGDKIEQIANMPWIYNQACITIVAARSDRASRGFLDDIDLAQSTKLAVRLPFCCPDQHGTLGSAYITYIDDSRGSEPIHSRAWTLQERYLSNRYIEFGRNQMRWVCACSGRLKRRGPLGLILRAMPCDTTRLFMRFTHLGLFHINTRSKSRVKEDTSNTGKIGAYSTIDCVDLFEKVTPEVIEIE